MFEGLQGKLGLGGWDLVLMWVVTLQGGVLAYLRAPRWKALALSLPFPYTTIALSLGRPVDATHPLAMLAMLAYIHSVRLLYQRARLPIAVSILLAVGAYCGVGMALLRWGGGIGFWPAAALSLAAGAAAFRLTPNPPEPDYRTPLPVWLKIPAVLAVVFVLVQVKGALQGFATLFPLLGVVGAYEARHSLWAVARQVPVLMMAMTPMMAAAYLTQERLGLAGGLAVGWVLLAGCLAAFAFARGGRTA